MRHRPISWKLLALLLVAAAGPALSGCAKGPITSPAPAESPGLQGVALDAASLARAEGDELLSHCPRGASAIAGPTVIDRPGVYRVVRDFQATGDAIVVRSDRVILWLGEHTISGPGAKLGRGVVLENVKHVLVQGGQLRNFGVAVMLDRASHCAVRGVDVEGADEPANPPQGIPPQIGVLIVNGAYNRIARNELEDVNLGLFVRGPGSRKNVLRRNQVVGGTNGLLGVCYNPAPGGGPEGPTGDLVVGNRFWRFGVGIQTSQGSAQNHFVGNSIGYFAAAWEDFNGTNVFRRNHTRQLTP